MVGAGTMGNGIAQVFAQAGFDVRLVDDVCAAALDRARATIEKSLAKFVEKGKLTADAIATRRSAACDRHRASTALADVDYVVEAILEDADAKRDLFGQLDAITRPEVILASNTSSISITLLGAATQAAGPRARHALHESGAADDAGRAGPRAGDVSRVDGDRVRVVQGARQDRASKPPTTPASSPTAS